MDARVVEELRAVLGPVGVLTDRARRTTYESDGLALARQLPDLVILPKDTRETAGAVRILHAHGIPVVPRGAGTGL